MDLYESDAEELQHRSPAALLPAGSPMNDSVATAGLKSDFLAGIHDEDEEPTALKQSATPQWKIMNPEDQGAWPASNGWGTPQEQREAEQRRRHEGREDRAQPGQQRSPRQRRGLQEIGGNLSQRAELKPNRDRNGDDQGLFNVDFAVKQEEALRAQKEAQAVALGHKFAV